MAKAVGSKNPQNLRNLDLSKQVFQFKIELKDTSPRIWRRIQVPFNFNFWGLHLAIQNSMGWLDCHLHCFEVKNPKNGRTSRIGLPENQQGKPWHLNEVFTQLNSPPEEPEPSHDWSKGFPTTADIQKDFALIWKQEENEHASWNVPLREYYARANFDTNYKYDFGDDWDHEVVFEGMFPVVMDPGQEYPICISGEKACPPEDCGGTYGFAELLKNLKKNGKKRNGDEREKIEWLHKHMKLPNYDPDLFDPSGVVFYTPKMWRKDVHCDLYKKSLII